MKKILFFLQILFLLSCTEKKKEEKHINLDQLAVKYTRLGLAIGAYDPDFVDAYYGPDSLKPAGPVSPVFPKDSFLLAVDNLKKELAPFITNNQADTPAIRAGWMTSQLGAFTRRINIFSGRLASFDEESKDLFGVTATVLDESYFKTVVARLDSALPGKGSVADRFQAMSSRFIIPKDKLDTVFKTAIAESRKRTLEHFDLPKEEQFTLEFVKNKPWSGYNWYKGNYQSLIQINTDLQVFIERAIDVASHESYPGHHVYNMLLEKNLYRGKGWVEVSLYPLFSPQSLIAEGSANYGIELAFPGKEKNKFAKEVLLPLAGLDTTGLDAYFAALDLRSALGGVRNEVGRRFLANSMTEQEAQRWLTQYALNNAETAAKSLSFLKKYRSYVINYGYGKSLVEQYILAHPGAGTSADIRWKAFGNLLSNEIKSADLSRK